MTTCLSGEIVTDAPEHLVVHVEGLPEDEAPVRRHGKAQQVQLKPSLDFMGHAVAGGKSVKTPGRNLPNRAVVNLHYS